VKKEMVGACSTYQGRCAYRVLVGKLEGKRWLGHVARIRGDVHTEFWWGNLRERDGWGM